jgi:phenylalanine ammonia-lyase
VGLLVEPHFSNGLAPCLVGNEKRRVNMGLKALQIVGNSIMPLISFFGNSLADRYPTHAEQYNQNINSQGFGSANLARESLDLLRHYLSLTLLFGVQAVDLRTRLMHGVYNAEAFLSAGTRSLYRAVRLLTGHPAKGDRPWLWDDDEHHLDLEQGRLYGDLVAQRSLLIGSLQPLPPL